VGRFVKDFPCLDFYTHAGYALFGRISLQQGDAVMADSLFSYLARVIIIRG